MKPVRAKSARVAVVATVVVAATAAVVVVTAVVAAAAAAVAATAALVTAMNPDAGLNATGVGLWLVLLALATFTLIAARKPALQPAAMALGGLVSLALAGGLIYLLVGFKIF